MGLLLFILIAYGGLPAAIWVLAWSSRRLRQLRTAEQCSRCGYELRGLDAGAKCPECGLERSIMGPPDPAIEKAAQRVGVALLPLSVTLFVSTTAALLTKPVMKIPELGVTVVAPYLVLAVATLILHRPSKLRRSLWRVLAPTAVGNGVLVYVLLRYQYWAAPIAVSAGAIVLFCIVVIPWAITNAEELLKSPDR